MRDTYGSTDVLELRDIDKPEGADGERALMLSAFVGQKLGTFISSANHDDLIVLKELIEAGKVTPAIDRTYPLSESPQAIRYMAEGHARGKVVITV
jgi:NADPH:quinone reductase-like Zn-dependent oxidoreductase